MSQRRQPHRSGFTLVEMMVAVGILSIVVAGVMQSFVVQNRAYTVVDQTTESQQNLRAIAYMLERDLRMAGYRVPEGAVACGIDKTDGPDTLYVSDSEPIATIDPNDATSRTDDAFGVDVTSPYAASESEQTLSVSSTILDDIPYWDSDESGGADSDFRIGSGAILFDAANPDRGTACGTVTDINPGTPGIIRVDFETALAAPGGLLVLVPAVRYTVDVANSALMRNDIVIANDIDDLQVAYFIDGDGNGRVSNDDEYEGSALASSEYESPGTDHSDLREIRFNLSIRSRTEDPTFQDGFMQALENRAAAGASDGFRRRTYTATVRPRNVGFRGEQTGS